MVTGEIPCTRYFLCAMKHTALRNPVTALRHQRGGHLSRPRVIDHEEIVRRLKLGEERIEIARECGCTVQNVHWVASKYGLSIPRTVSDDPKNATIRVSRDHLKMLNRLAAEQGRSRSLIAREMIDEWIENHAPELAKNPKSKGWGDG